MLVGGQEPGRRHLSGKKDPVTSRIQTGGNIPPHRLGDDFEGSVDLRRLFPQVRQQSLVARQFFRDRQGTKNGLKDRRVVPAPLHDLTETSELSTQCPLLGIQGTNLRPVAGTFDRMIDADPGAVDAAAVRDATAPVHHSIDPGGHDLDEIQVMAGVKGEQGLGQCDRILVEIRKMPPEAHRSSVDGLSYERCLDPLCLRHHAPKDS